VKIAQSMNSEVLEAYCMIAADLLVNRISDGIRPFDAGRDNRPARCARLPEPGDRPLPARAARRSRGACRWLIFYLTGDKDQVGAPLPDNVVSSRNMGPAELLDYDTRKLRACSRRVADGHTCVTRARYSGDRAGWMRYTGRPLDSVMTMPIWRAAHRPSEDIQQAFREHARAR
jgi:signal transduction protein with GAF and PtsI domain